jgi:hypothetical protein
MAAIVKVGGRLQIDDLGAGASPVCDVMPIADRHDHPTGDRDRLGARSCLVEYAYTGVLENEVASLTSSPASLVDASALEPVARGA